MASFTPRPHPQARFLPVAGGRAGPWCPAVRGQPPAATQCPPAGSGAASYPGVHFQSRGQPGRAPARCPITGPAFYAAPAPARAPLTPRAAPMPGRCAAQHGAAHCLGTQATQSECPCPPPPPAFPPDPLPDPVWFCADLENRRGVHIPANLLLVFNLDSISPFSHFGIFF